MFLLIELCLTAVAIGAAVVFPKVGANWFARWEQRFVRLARRRRFSVVVVGLAALLLRAALLPILPIPHPTIHDEFGYLLAADTFAHGRLTNPTHPMWVHFETFSIIQKPTYQCFAPPAQGVILALGKVVFGHPFWGVWLSCGLMCAAICWMLQAWLPEEWALYGGLLAVIRLAAFSYWGDSYWGGAAAATGGALVLGALPRIKQSQRVRDALAMGAGLAILANSRPYEGLIFSLPVMAALAVWLLGKDRPALGSVARRVVAPLALVLVLTGGAMGYYFWRVTGDPFRLPYQVNRSTYAVAPYFIWQSPRPEPIYHHPLIRALYTQWELPQFMAARSLSGFLSATLIKAYVVWLFYLGSLFLLTMLTVVAIAPYDLSWGQLDSRTRFLLKVAAVSLGGLLPEAFYLNPHYAAPITCVIFALLLIAMRHLWNWRWRGERAGVAVVRAVTMAGIGLLVLRATAKPLHLSVRPPLAATWYSVQEQDPDRAPLLAQLQAQAGPQLAIVRYAPTHNIHAEWVYNSHDIDGSKVVWARDMGPDQNQELIRYFKDRQVWLVEPDETPPRLTAYSEIGDTRK